MEQRKTPIASFYANILNFRNYYKNKWFPYTMPISDIYGLRTALENVQADPDIHARHKKIPFHASYIIHRDNAGSPLIERFLETLLKII